MNSRGIYQIAQVIKRALVFVCAVLALVLPPASGVFAAPLAAVQPCTEAGLNAALAAGGTNTFSCASATTIVVSATKTISKDTVLDGGGLLTISGGGLRQVFVVGSTVTATLQNLTIAYGKYLSNGQGTGGGVSNGGTLTINNCTFLENGSDGKGGGIYNEGALTISNSTFSGNTSVLGGGIFNFNTMTISNSTFWNNQADGKGGGVYNVSNTTITNSTISGNTAGNPNGGGIFNDTGTSSPAKPQNSTGAKSAATATPSRVGVRKAIGVTLRNTIVANNTSRDCAGAPIDNGGNNIDSDYTCNVDTDDPKLGTLANNGGSTQTMALGANSPAIDAANPANCPQTDQRGFGRVSTCDIGAFEYGAKGNTTTTLTGPSGNYTAPQGFTFTATVTQSTGGVTQVNPSIAKTTVRAPTQTGTVTFYDNGGAIAGCTNVPLDPNTHQATCTVTLGVGTHVISAVYSGDGNYSPSTTTTTLTITIAQTVVLKAPADVPEGDTLLLVGGGLSGLGVWLRWRWSKRRKQ